MGRGKAWSDSVNPITLARESIGMSTAELVIASGGSTSNVWNLERGMLAHPTRNVIAALAAAGADVREIEEKYLAWRAKESKATILRFAATAGARG